jgi:hypothetical protein
VTIALVERWNRSGGAKQRTKSTAVAKGYTQSPA